MNKYLEKVASLGEAAESVRGFGKSFAKGWKRSSTTSKIGLGMSATGLGLSAANFSNSIQNKHRDNARALLEQQSLDALRGISETLKKKPKVTVNLRLAPDGEKQASVGDAAKDAFRFAKRYPLTTAGGVIGAADGAGQTTRKKNESAFKVGVRGIRNTVTGAVAGAAVGGVADHVVNKYIRK